MSTKPSPAVTIPSTHPTPDAPRLTSLVFRLKRGRLDELKTLTERTRVRQSEYLREAVSDLLAKYAAPEEKP